MTFVNEGLWDRVIRMVIGVALGYAAWMTWPGTASIVFTVIAAMAVLTGVIGWCPAYPLFGISTTKKKVV